MRMGKLGKRERIGRGYQEENKPNRTARGTVVGAVSTNLINSIYLPLFSELATQELETYLAAKIQYDEWLVQQDASSTITNDDNENEAEVQADGSVSVKEDMMMMEEEEEEPVPPVFGSQVAIDDFKETLEEMAKHFSQKGWKVHANAAKFERQLDEKYGIFRPLITSHPELEQFIRTIQRKSAMGHFSPLKKPVIPRTTSIIILFMMQGRVQWQLLVLATLFLLVGLQPWALVVLVSILQLLVQRRKAKPLGKMGQRNLPTIQSYHRYNNNNNNETTTTTTPDNDDKKHKELFLLKPVGTKLEDSTEVDMSLYDTLIVGFGVGTLYKAALLSRAGRKVLVVSPRVDASGCLTLQHCQQDGDVANQFRNVPFDVETYNVPRISRQQEMLVPALCSSTDYQGGIRFAQIGSEADGYAFEILSIPGMGANKGKDCIPFVLRAAGGVAGLMEDTASLLGDGWPGSDQDVGNSTVGAYLEAVQAMNAPASQFYISKALPDNVNDMRSKNTYAEACIRFTSNFLDQCFPLNPHCRSLMAGIGMKGENIKPSRTSMGPHVTNVCAATSGEGMHYPIGGPRALCHALASVVEQCGGKVLTGAQVKELVLDLPLEKPVPPSEAEPREVPHPRCLGVKLVNDRILQFDKTAADDKAVISDYGIIDTFVYFVEDSVRNTYKVPRGLQALSERRPTIKILFALRGSADELEVSGADFYRLPAASLAMDSTDPETGVVKYGEIGTAVDSTGEEGGGGGDAVSAAEINAEPKTEQSGATRKPKRPRRNKFYTGTSWIKISFPSAKDPSFADRHGAVTTCVVTVEADDDFVHFFDTKPKLYSITKNKGHGSDDAQRLLERVKRDLLETFPQLEDKVLHAEVHGPFRGGLSHTPERYAAKGVHTSTPYPGLYMGGSDLTVGDSFSGAMIGGWLAANAVMGYESLDHLFLNKNITSDLERYIEEPDELDDDEEEDVAVPFTPPADRQEPVPLVNAVVA